MRILFILIYLLTATMALGQSFDGTLVFERKNEERERRQGLVDSLGNIILPAEYGSVRITDDGRYIVASKQKGLRYVERGGFYGGEEAYPDYKYGVLDADLKTVLPFVYNNIDTYRKPYYVYHEEQGTAVFNENFKEIIPFKYESIRYIKYPYQAYFYTTKDGFSGVINKKGKQILAEQPFWIEPLSKKLFAVRVKGSTNNSYATAPYYLMDKDLNKVNDLSIYFFQFLTPKVILVSTGPSYHDTKVGLMDTDGTVLLPTEYNWISYDEKNSVYIVKISKYGKSGMLNKNLDTILQIEYDEIKAGKDTDLFLVSKNKKYGFANAEGEIVIDLMYDGADVFSEGLAPVLKNGKWGFINEQGNVAIDFKFEGRLKSFQNGYATHYKDNQSVFINKKGEIIGEPKKGNIHYFSKHKAVWSQGNGNEYLIDLKTGDIIFNLKQQ